MCESLQDLAELDTVACAIARKIQSLDLDPRSTEHLLAILTARLNVSGEKAHTYNYRLSDYFPPLERPPKPSANSIPPDCANQPQNLAVDPKTEAFAPLKKQKKRKKP